MFPGVRAATTYVFCTGANDFEWMLQKGKEEAEKWLPDQDLNLDKLNQNQLCYRYTIRHQRFTVYLIYPLFEKKQAGKTKNQKFFNFPAVCATGRPCR